MSSIEEEEKIRSRLELGRTKSLVSEETPVAIGSLLEETTEETPITKEVNEDVLRQWRYMLDNNMITQIEYDALAGLSPQRVLCDLP